MRSTKERPCVGSAVPGFAEFLITLLSLHSAKPRFKRGRIRVIKPREQPEAYAALPVGATSATSGIATSNCFIACRQTRGSPCPLTKMVLPGGLVVCT